ncbi:hypothetical protein ABKV19_020330 [Rosa sericea]
MKEGLEALRENDNGESLQFKSTITDLAQLSNSRNPVVKDGSDNEAENFRWQSYDITQETTTTINAKPAKSNVKKVRIIVSTLVYSTGQLILGVTLLVYVWKKDAEKLSRSHKENLELPSFDLATVVNATCNFSNDNKLGDGDFRSVFKFILALLEDLQKMKQKQEQRKLLEHTMEFWWKRNRGFSHPGQNLNFLDMHGSYSQKADPSNFLIHW